MERPPRKRLIRDLTIGFKDHTGKPSLMVWQGSSEETPLPPLWSFVFYFIHPEASIGDLEPTATTLLSTFSSWPYDVRLDIHFLPNATDEDCVDHFKAELRQRGSVFVQIAALDAPDDDLTHSPDDLPGLVPSYSTGGEVDFYRNFIFVVTTHDWQNERQRLKLIEFGALDEQIYRRYMEEDEQEVDGPLPEVSTEEIYLRSEDMDKADPEEFGIGDVLSQITEVRLGDGADEVIAAWGRGLKKGWQTWPVKKI